MTDKQPEALRLAYALEQGTFLLSVERDATAAELRRLHQSEREGWRHAAELEQERERLTNLCHDYLGELTAMRAVKQMQEQKVRFKCTVIDDQHPNGVPLEQWGNAAHRQWVGLTRNEAMEIINSLVGQDWMYAVDAIEAKLREKNAA